MLQYALMLQQSTFHTSAITQLYALACLIAVLPTTRLSSTRTTTFILFATIFPASRTVAATEENAVGPREMAIFRLMHYSERGIVERMWQVFSENENVLMKLWNK